MPKHPRLRLRRGPHNSEPRTRRLQSTSLLLKSHHPPWSMYRRRRYTHIKDVPLAYLDFTSALPSVNHTQSTHILHFLGIPEYFIIIVSNLNCDAHTQFLTPYGWTCLVEILRGTLQGDSLSPLIFDLMVEPLIRWIKSTREGYTLASNNLSLSSK